MAYEIKTAYGTVELTIHAANAQDMRDADMAGAGDVYTATNWFRGNIEAALEDAETADEAATILSAAYLGPDVDGVTVTWAL